MSFLSLFHCLFPVNKHGAGRRKTSKGSILSVHIAKEAGQLVFFVNSPWCPKRSSWKDAGLWQLLSKAPRYDSPFANNSLMDRLLGEIMALEDSFCRTPRLGSSSGGGSGGGIGSSSGRHRRVKWRSLDAFVRRLHARRRALSHLHPPPHGLCGCVTLEVSWSDVRGLRYENELQAEANLAMEVTRVVKREFDSFDQAVHAHALRLYPTTPSHGPMPLHETTPLHGANHSHSSVPAANTLLLFRFTHPHLPAALADVITTDQRLLHQLESGLPAWAVFLQSTAGLSALYRSWMRPLVAYACFIVSLVTVLIGFYDLYKNIPAYSCSVLKLAQLLSSLVTSHLSFLYSNGLLLYRFLSQACSSSMWRVSQLLSAQLSFLYSRAALLGRLLGVLVQPLLLLARTLWAVGRAIILPLFHFIHLLLTPLLSALLSLLKLPLQLLRLLLQLSSFLYSTFSHSFSHSFSLSLASSLKALSLHLTHLSNTLSLHLLYLSKTLVQPITYSIKAVSFTFAYGYKSVANSFSYISKAVTSSLRLVGGARKLGSATKAVGQQISAAGSAVGQVSAAAGSAVARSPPSSLLQMWHNLFQKVGLTEALRSKLLQLSLFKFSKNSSSLLQMWHNFFQKLFRAIMWIFKGVGSFVAAANRHRLSTRHYVLSQARKLQAWSLQAAQHAQATMLKYGRKLLAPRRIPSAPPRDISASVTAAPREILVFVEITRTRRERRTRCLRMLGTMHSKMTLMERPGMTRVRRSSSQATHCMILDSKGYNSEGILLVDIVQSSSQALV
ncbi:unnamed protein product [Closterium sp. Yama58-4]|nr:unnamed protein product [Closterium sp. Yama58-4]